MQTFAELSCICSETLPTEACIKICEKSTGPVGPDTATRPTCRQLVGRVEATAGFGGISHAQTETAAT
jgi:hypothetical protein